jgi:hypothetical protein
MKNRLILFPRLFRVFLLAALSGVAAMAYPPAPHHTLYGQVRDEWGNPINIGGEVILETSAGIKIKAEIAQARDPGTNYYLEIPMDSGLTADAYKPTALRPTVPFHLVVRINGINYLPIEMKANFASLGLPGKRTRMDLTLGEDSDGDGLPDAWERALLATLGGGNLNAINPGDDSDGDGLSNLNEYLAGTYAFDPQDSFELKLTTANNAAASLEFMVIRGRAYTILHSTDMKLWSSVAFTIEGETASRTVYQANDARVLRVKTPVQQDDTGALGFYKLIVQ